MHHLHKFTLGLCCAFALAACDSNSDVQPADFTQDIAINIEAAMIDGDFTLNTTNFPASFYQRGYVSLRDSNNNAMTLLGESWEGGYNSLMIIDGTYDSVYERIEGNLVPHNAYATASTGHVVDVDQTLDIDVPRVIVVPTFTVDGNAFPTSVYNSAEFFLRPVGTDELISLGTTNNQPSENVMVTPGTYDVIYGIREGDQLPQNEQAVVMRNVDVSTTPHVLNIDVETNQFSGSWRLATNGVVANFPATVVQHGVFSLRTDDGDFVALGPSHIFTGRLAVIAGTYDVVYSHEQGDQVPQNKDKVVQADLVLAVGQTTLEGVVDAWTTAPKVSLDGAAFPGSVYESGEVFLLDEDTGALTSLGRTHNALPAALLAGGSYDTVYNHVDGSSIPRNNSAVLGINVVIDDADEAFDVAVTSASVDSNFSLDGGKFPQSVYEEADFLMYRDGAGEGIHLGTSHTPSEPVVVLAGDYDIVYQFVDGSQIPRNPHHVILDDETLSGNDIVNVNVLSRAVRPAFTLNSQPFPASVYERGEFFLRGNHAADRVTLGTSSEDPEDRIVIRGSYDALYEHVQGSTVPQNTVAIVGEVSVN